MKHLKFLLGIIIMLLVVILLVENHEAFSTKIVFKIDFFTFHYKSPEITLYYITAIVFLLGILISALYGIVERFRLKKQIKILNQMSKDKDKELNSLRNLPITSDNMVSNDLDHTEKY